MSLPQFDVQGSLFESLGAIAPDLFSEGDKYKLFAKKIWPVLAGCREQLMECYEVDNARPTSRGVSKVSFGLETGIEFEVERKRFPPNHVGLLPPTTDRTR